VLLGVKDRNVQIGSPTRRTIRAFLAFEAATFAIAALIHANVLPLGDPHEAAATGESVIAVIVLVGLALTWAGIMSVATIGMIAQGFVGIFTIAVGAGPRTAPDVAYHVAISGVLVVGLVVASRRLA